MLFRSDAVKLLTVNPAKMMGLKTKGDLVADFDADIVVFDKDVNVKAVFANGKRAV